MMFRSLLGIHDEWAGAGLWTVLAGVGKETGPINLAWSLTISIGLQRPGTTNFQSRLRGLHPLDDAI